MHTCIVHVYIFYIMYSTRVDTQCTCVQSVEYVVQYDMDTHGYAWMWRGYTCSNETVLIDTKIPYVLVMDTLIPLQSDLG